MHSVACGPSHRGETRRATIERIDGGEQVTAQIGGVPSALDQRKYLGSPDGIEDFGQMLARLENAVHLVLGAGIQ
ncbi:hypothetical protein BH09ACT8_BH09ACT8_11770 [soil metagenome]